MAEEARAHLKVMSLTSWFGLRERQSPDWPQANEEVKTIDETGKGSGARVRVVGEDLPHHSAQVIEGAIHTEEGKQETEEATVSEEQFHGSAERLPLLMSSQRGRKGGAAFEENENED